MLVTCVRLFKIGKIRDTPRTRRWNRNISSGEFEPTLVRNLGKSINIIFCFSFQYVISAYNINPQLSLCSCGLKLYKVYVIYLLKLFCCYLINKWRTENTWTFLSWFWLWITWRKSNKGWRKVVVGYLFYQLNMSVNWLILFSKKNRII